MLLQETDILPFSQDLILPDPLSQSFTAIFCHRWHFILKEADEWRTETKYPIKPAALWKLWQDARTFIGVRFGQLTPYGLIDIDIESPYHPDQDPLAIPAIVSALESIGIYRTLIIRSSDSGGIHIYVPLESAIATYGLATALKFCCEDAGFKLAPGQLEIFPNCKSYRVDSFTDYNAHRLPLQSGSYLLNRDYQPISNDLEHFLNVWEMSAAGNDRRELEEAIALYKKRPVAYARSNGQSRGEKWKQDCEAAIATGWTDHGQTNELIGTFAQYGRVFLALAGEELTEWMVATAINAPGYAQWCRHQHEIQRRCRDWAKGTEGYYFPYPAILPRSRSQSPWGKSDANDEKSSGAVERIRTAYEAVKSLAFKTVTDLANSITAIAKCSLATLYKNRVIWHPKTIDESNSECNSQTPYTETDTDLTGNLAENSTETLEPLPDGLLHTRCPKKVLNPVMNFESDQPPQKTHSQPPTTPLGFDFCERNHATDTPNQPLDSDSRDYSGFSTNREKESLSGVDFSGCCNADTDLACQFFKGDRDEPFKMNPRESVSQKPFPVWDSDDSG